MTDPKLSDELKRKVEKREMLKTVEIEEIIPRIELLETELNDYQKGADEILDKAEKWDGYLEIVEVVKKKALGMELHLEKDPLRLPVAYLEIVMEYLNEAARHIETRNLSVEVRKLPKKWRSEADGSLPSDREIGYEHCADELEKLVKRKDRRRKENR